MTNQTLYVDRIEASQILKTSTRTVDRYLRKYRCKTRKDGRRVLIKKNDLDQIIKDHIGKFVDFNEDKMESILNNETTQAPEETTTNLTVKDIKIENIKEPEAKSEDNAVFKELYEETKKELHVKQERLEAATYRVGQLEAQVKTMVPMLDYTKKDQELQEAFSTMEQKAKQNQELVDIMERKLRSERVAKYIYLSLVGLLLVAEPILFLMWAFN